MSEPLMVDVKREAAAKAEMQRIRGIFITERLDQKRNELGVKEFKKQREKLTKEFERQWEQLQKAKATIRELEERMTRQIIEWTPLKAAYQAKLEAEGYNKQIIENTIKSRRSEFERAQKIVKARLRPKLNPDEDFKCRVLNPETRREAVKKYLIDHTNKTHFLAEAFNLIFEELDKRKWK